MAATPNGIGKRQREALLRERRMQNGEAPSEASSTSGTIAEPAESVSTSTSTPTSSSSDAPSSDSNKCWRKPKTIKEFASQANAIATMILNGEIDMDKARNYASLARVVAQATSIEVTRARFLKEEPDLSLEVEDEG